MQNACQHNAVDLPQTVGMPWDDVFFHGVQARRREDHLDPKVQDRNELQRHLPE